MQTRRCSDYISGYHISGVPLLRLKVHIELRVGDGDAAGVQLALDGLVHSEAHVEVVAACGPQHQKVLDAAVLIVVQHDQRGRILQRLRMLRRGEQGLADLLRRSVIRHADIEVHAAAAVVWAQSV